MFIFFTILSIYLSQVWATEDYDSSRYLSERKKSFHSNNFYERKEHFSLEEVKEDLERLKKDYQKKQRILLEDVLRIQKLEAILGLPFKIYPPLDDEDFLLEQSTEFLEALMEKTSLIKKIRDDFNHNKERDIQLEEAEDKAKYNKRKRELELRKMQVDTFHLHEEVKMERMREIFESYNEEIEHTYQKLRTQRRHYEKLNKKAEKEESVRCVIL